MAEIVLAVAKFVVVEVEFGLMVVFAVAAVSVLSLVGLVAV